MKNYKPAWWKKPFPECITPVRFERSKQIKTNSYLPIGDFPIIDQGQTKIAGWTNDKSAVINDNLPLIIFGDHTRVFKYIDFPFAIGADGTKIIKPNRDEFCSRYIYYYLQNLNLPSRGYSRHYKLLKESEISYPEIPEQQKIAAVLLKIQQAIEVQESIIEAAQELKKSTMQHVFTYGLRGEKTKETEIGRIPESWGICSLGALALIIMGQSPKGDYYNKEGEGLPLLNGPAEFTRKYPQPVQWTMKSTKIAKKYDILFCVRGNTVARMNIADQDYCIGRGVAAISGKKLQSITEFILYLIEHNSHKIYSYATAGGSTFPNFSKTDFDMFRVAKPSVSEQQKIADILISIDEKIELHTSKRTILRDLFKTMLNKLMSGEIRVKDSDIDTSCVLEMKNRG